MSKKPDARGDNTRVLTAADVRVIRRSKESLRVIAARYGGTYGLSPGTVHAIRTGRTWKWVK